MNLEEVITAVATILGVEEDTLEVSVTERLGGHYTIDVRIRATE